MRREVGKSIGGCLYVHRDYAPASLKDWPVPEDWDWTIVKIDLSGKKCSFIKCDDFDSAHEPTVGDSLIVKADGSIKIVRAPKDPWIYHHKWLMVGDDYKGFDVEESKARSESWRHLDVDKARIGKKSYWEENVLPLLKSERG